MAVLTFQYLRELQKKERDSPLLQQIDANFYRTLSECIKQSSDSETIIQIIRSILDMRERKIVSTAIKSARADIRPQNLLPEEEPLFTDVSDAIKKYRSETDGALSGDATNPVQNDGKEPEKPRVKTSNKTVEETIPAPENIKKEEQAKPNVDTVEVRARSDIPAFVAEDMKTYGPVKAGETAKIPKKAAAILAKSKSAEILE